MACPLGWESMKNLFVALLGYDAWWRASASTSCTCESIYVGMGRHVMRALVHAYNTPYNVRYTDV
jgi:hypothetical protein